MWLSPFLLLLSWGSPLAADPPADRCASCRALTSAIDDQILALRTHPWRKREAAARDLARYRWECHPEVVSALTAALQSDDKPRVRAEAAESLGRMVPNLPISHVALAAAAQSDPTASVRHQASKALAAKGLRCVTDCPICGLLPRNAAITGPVLTLPEWTGQPKPTPGPPISTVPPDIKELP